MNHWIIVFGVLLAFAVICLLYGFLVEPKRLRERRVVVKLPFPEATSLSKPIKIVFFSDIHLGAHLSGDDVSRQMNAIMACQPDAIIFGGDLVEEATPIADETFRKDVVSFLSALEAPLGKWAVMGNHDVEAPRFRRWTEDVLRSSGFTLLENESAHIAELPVVGLEDALHGKPGVDFEKWRRPDNSLPFTLFISHEPDTALLLKDAGARGLVLSGHSHHGQITFFGYPPVRVPGARQFVKGLDRVSPDLSVFVSSGLGTVHIHARFFARPDFVTVMLEPSETAAEIAYTFDDRVS